MPMLRSFRSAVVAAACLSLATTALANSKPFGDYDKITETRLKAHLEFIAHDLLEGRDTPSRGLDIAAEYIAAHMKLIGATPGGENGTYFQTMNWGRDRLNLDNSKLTIGGQEITIGEGALPAALAPVDTEAEVVFVPGGWSNPAKGVDPFANTDVKGKIVVTDNQGPEGVNRQELFREWTNVATAAQKAGAVAVVTIAAQANPATWQRSVERLVAGGAYRAVSGETPLPSLTLSAEAAQSLFSAELPNVNPGTLREATLKSGLKMSLKLDVVQERQTAYNVIAIVPGSDPVLKNEYVGVGSHLDHVGIGRPDEDGDAIYNGADDDGSGNVAMIEMAYALMNGSRPKRSTVFIWHCGEEKGLVGSEYFAENPTIDLTKMKFMVNIDMIGMAKQPGDTNPRNNLLAAKNEVYVIGPKTMSTTMAPVLERVNGQVHNMKLNDLYDRVDHPERIFFRSDHISYVRKGVPAIFLFSGIHAHYHRPSDEVDKIDFEQLLTNTQTLFAITYEMANIANVPKIDKTIPGIND